MNYPADSTAKLCQGGKGRYVGREGVPMDNCSCEKCDPIIVFESHDLSVYGMVCDCSISCHTHLFFGRYGI